MGNYTDGLAPCKLQDGAPQQVATKDDLFSAALKHLKRASLARTAAEMLFWCQYAKQECRGRKGIYKEDKELGRDLGVNPKTAGRHVRRLCAAASNGQAGTAS